MRWVVSLFIGAVVVAILFSGLYGGVLVWQESQQTRRAEAAAQAQSAQVERSVIEAASRERLAAMEQALTETQAELNRALAELEMNRATGDVLRITGLTNQQVTLQLVDEATKALRDDRRIAGWSFVRATAQEVVLGLLLCAVAVMGCVGCIVWLYDRSGRKR